MAKWRFRPNMYAGKRNGKEMAWNEKGQLVSEDEFENGKPVKH